MWGEAGEVRPAWVGLHAILGCMAAGEQGQTEDHDEGEVGPGLPWACGPLGLGTGRQLGLGQMSARPWHL